MELGKSCFDVQDFLLFKIYTWYIINEWLRHIMAITHNFKLNIQHGTSRNNIKQKYDHDWSHHAFAGATTWARFASLRQPKICIEKLVDLRNHSLSQKSIDSTKDKASLVEMRETMVYKGVFKIQDINIHEYISNGPLSEQSAKTWLLKWRELELFPEAILMTNE